MRTFSNTSPNSATTSQCASLPLSLSKTQFRSHFKTYRHLVPTLIFLPARTDHIDLYPNNDLSHTLGAGGYIRSLHWLWVPERIEFRLCVLAYRCLQSPDPPYLASGLHRTTENHARRSLLSADTTSLLVPPTRRTTLGDRAFFVAAPRAWNSLSPALRGTTSLVTFRRDLKAIASLQVKRTNDSKRNTNYIFSVGFF